jgi:hypothetical protein
VRLRNHDRWAAVRAAELVGDAAHDRGRAGLDAGRIAHDNHDPPTAGPDDATADVANGHRSGG